MFITVLTQVIILFILILLGVIFNKTKILNATGAKNITDIILYLVTPCVLIKSFIREYSSELFKNLLIGCLATLVAHIIFIIVSSLLIKDSDISRQKVLQFGAIFSNCGYMAIPLLQAVLGDDGVFYGATYIAIFHVITWSYGIFLMGDGIKTITPKKIFLNPGLIGFVLAFLVFVLQIPVPKIAFEPISYMASLNTPLPMIIIGYHLANSNILAGIKDLKLLFATVLKLVVFPIVVIFTFYLCGLRGTLPLALSICASAPTAAICTMFSAKFERATDVSATMVSITTIFSIISMPLVLTFAEKLLV